MEQVKDATATRGAISGPQTAAMCGWPARNSWPGLVRHPGRHRAGQRQAQQHVLPQHGPVHDVGMAHGGEAAGREQPLPEAAVRLLQRHRGVAFHLAGDAALRLAARLRDQAGAQEPAEQQRQQADHQHAADELGQGETPAHQQRQQDAELEHQVGGSELEGDRGGEIGALAEQRSRDRDGGVGAGRGRRAEHSGPQQRPGRGVRQGLGHARLRHGHLDHGREQEAEADAPEDLPSHQQRHAQGLPCLTQQSLRLHDSRCSREWPAFQAARGRARFPAGAPAAAFSAAWRSALRAWRPRPA